MIDASNDAADAERAAQRPRRLGRLGLAILAAGLLAFLAWAALAPLDEGVPSQGLVSIDTKRKTVQHLQGGIVKEVLVHEGQAVTQGQLLIRLDDAVARANFEAVRQRYLAMRAHESRLLAEQRGLERIVFHPAVTAAAADPMIARHLQTQEQLFTTRRLALKADLQAIEESIGGQEAAIASYRAMLESRTAQKRLLAEQLDGIRDLVREGYAPRNQQLDLERQVGEIATAIIDLQGNERRARQMVAELRQRALSRQQEYRKETDTQLADASREAQSDEGKLAAVEDDLDRTRIKSPAAGQVVGLVYQSVGGVVPPGQRLMDIVPESQALLLETRIAPNLIDRVHAGQLADVRFSAFAHSPQLVVQGRLMSVSGDLLVEQTQAGNVNYYLARVEITPEGLKTLGSHQMQPGMPVEVVIKTGSRTLLTYLLHPLTRRVAASMKEQ